MNLSALLKTQLDMERVIAYRVCLAEICNGDILAGLFLAQALYWAERTRHVGGWFFKTGPEWHRETGLTRHQLDRVRMILRTKGFLEERRGRNNPPAVYYRLNQGAIESALVPNARKRQMKQLNCSKMASPLAINQQVELREPDNSYKEQESTSQSTSNKRSSDHCKILVSINVMGTSQVDSRERASVKTIWCFVLASLKQDINPHSFDTWLRPTHGSHAENDRMFVRVPSPQFAYIATKYGRQISKAIAEFGYREVALFASQPLNNTDNSAQRRRA